MNENAGVSTTRVTAAVVEAKADTDAGFESAAAELAGVASEDEKSVAGRTSADPSSKGETLSIPAGTFPSGSTPGDEGREPSLEPALVDVTLKTFAIDALPYPNDPTKPPTLASSEREAERFCEEQGARLCTELEWERACKGPEGADRFSTGPTWSATCDRTPTRCSSGFGVRAMGFLPEWTSSKIGDAPVLRGGSRLRERRCASRSQGKSSHDKKGPSPRQASFRCCHGERNEALMPEIELHSAFKRSSLDAEEVSKIFATIPELSKIGDGIRFFSDADVKSILARSSASADGISFATSPLLWNPEPGVEVLVVTGRAKKSDFIVALHVLPHDRYRFASALLLLRDVMPVALAYEHGRRKELRWTTCWSCAGEQGAVSLRDDGRVVIVQY